MIVIRAPLRISFFGGGTDIYGFWKQDVGKVISTSIRKYIYVFIFARDDNHIYLDYLDKEFVSGIDEIRHEIIRECLRLTGLLGGVNIVVRSDVTSNGSGLGSSSTLTVALLHALFMHLGQQPSPEMLAILACHIEIDLLHKPIGKQDQYIAAYGGFRVHEFLPSGKVTSAIPDISCEEIVRLEKHLILFSTQIPRKAESILSRQSDNIESTRPILSIMRDHVDEAIACLQRGDMDHFGLLIQEGWELKKKLSSGISNARIDSYIERSIAAGAYGVKIAGAGGGGHMLVVCKPELQGKVITELAELAKVKVGFDSMGSTAITLEDYNKQNGHHSIDSILCSAEEAECIVSTQQNR
ncbi:D-glycero-alpha-D-manno-heptose-7-phosphate kinase [Fontibacillus phaseoli]|uniref:D-glycero-alpha-D-manno-heptose-7-phosphate kinase n=1 Tax=Fontibacillus phaseoli TaxID=1416533 RepID=A0A369B9W1_9BACL|nr:GHMP kinase [Fontibacillus phaseoli]RCX17346.1 D-glycero-alpha-D-manno-heptose-7-phosphate kinase [Fontibacillus phaseoli]